MTPLSAAWRTSRACAIAASSRCPSSGSMRAHSIERRWWVSPRSASARKSSAYRVANPLPSPETGACPARSQSHQSEAGAAPSVCVDDAPVPHMNPLGQSMGAVCPAGPADDRRLPTTPRRYKGAMTTAAQTSGVQGTIEPGFEQVAERLGGFVAEDPTYAGTLCALTTTAGSCSMCGGGPARSPTSCCRCSRARRGGGPRARVPGPGRPARPRRAGRGAVARVRRGRQGRRAGADAAQPPGRPARCRRWLQLRRALRARAAGGTARRAVAALGAGERVRVPRAHDRRAGRRARAPGDGTAPRGVPAATT